MNPWIYLLLITLPAGFGGGYYVRDLQADADQAKAVKVALATQAENERVSRDEEIALIKAQQKTDVVYKAVIKEAPKHVSAIQKTDSDCNLSHGIVRLFNRAAAEQLPKPARIDDAGSIKSSTVSSEYQ